ncbi:MAG: DUF2264 domain-containing protein [Lactobacillales bacterium]|jgi:hypothetical protein|nr:DUF2264 domain-containing protein [Lactobacillales bacterium]
MKKIQENPFLTKNDFSEAVKTLVAPIRQAILQTKSLGLHLGSSGAVYSENRAEMESLIRPLWGLAPLWTAFDEEDLRQSYLEKISNGTNPQNKFYWGKVENYDQYIVEMAAISVTLLLHKALVWEKLTEEEQKNLSAWLRQALDKKIPKNNWTFFKVLIRIALFHCGEDLDHEALDSELELIDAMYIGEGWYMDGKTTQRDYYIPFAFHFYGLIYAKFMRKVDNARAEIFIHRATRFAQDFAFYFDVEGEALPFGRSLTYRFAQSAFFSALVFCDVEALPWSEVKGLLARNMRCWMNHDIFTFDGRLSIGYHYENLVMGEGYNAPGSVYWAFKTFLILAVDEKHSFWQATPVEFHAENGKKLVKQGNMLLVRENHGKHVLGYPAQLMIEGQAHAEAKYSKFVYSTKFGFSVPKASVTYEEGAFDNTLAVSLDGKYYRCKREILDYKITEERVYHKWSPFPEVLIETEIFPIGEWHVRVHQIQTAVPLELREGGFSVPLLGRNPHSLLKQESATVFEGALCSKIYAIEGYDKAEIVRPEVNTSLFFPRTTFPALRKKVDRGTHLLISLVGGLTIKEELTEE